jgi:GPH family glycoside/pentoside/hexuronide:cation symporter
VGAPPLSVRLKTASGAGQLVESVSTTVYGTFLFFYYTAILGLPGGLVGLATGAALVIDAVADPLLGSLSDNLRTAWGRRTPFMALGGPLVALGTGLVFAPPAGLSNWGLFAWLTAVSLLLRFAVSTFQVPFIALGAEMSQDYAERSSVVAYRTLYSIFGPLLVLMLGYGVFLGGKVGLRHAAGYAPLGWSAAAIILIGGVVSILGVGRFAAAMPTPKRDDAALHRRLAGELSEIFRNPSFRVLFAAAVLFYVAQGVAGNFGQYMNLFVWKISSGQILLTALALFAGLMAGVPLSPILARRLEKRTLVIGGLAVLCLAQGGLTGLRALHIFTLTGDAVVGALSLNAFVAGIGVTLSGVSIASMMADAADEHDFLFETRREGLYFAGLGFAGKAATGLGAVVAGFLLDVIGFPHSAAASGVRPAEGVLDALIWVSGPFVGLVSLVATSLLFLYRIDRERHAHIMGELRRRAGG